MLSHCEKSVRHCGEALRARSRCALRSKPWLFPTDRLIQDCGSFSSFFKTAALVGRAWTSDIWFSGHRAPFYNTWTRFRRTHQRTPLWSHLNEESSIKWLSVLWILIYISSLTALLKGQWKVGFWTWKLLPSVRTFQSPQRRKLFFYKTHFWQHLELRTFFAQVILCIL